MTEEKSEIFNPFERNQLSAEERKKRNQLRFRNVLNIAFMVLALIAMVGIGLGLKNDQPSDWAYAVGVIAVLVKFAEAMLRMPASLTKPRRSRFDKRGR